MNEQEAREIGRKIAEAEIYVKIEDHCFAVMEHGVRAGSPNQKWCTTYVTNARKAFAERITRILTKEKT